MSRPAYMLIIKEKNMKRFNMTCLALLPLLFVTLFASNVNTSSAARDLLIPSGVWHGVFLDIKNQVSASQITTFESQASKKIGAEIYYVGWYVGAWANVMKQVNV